MADLIANAAAHLDALAFRALAATGARAFGVAVTDRAGLLHERAYGFTGAAGTTALTPRHAFDPGSIGKAFAATLALRAATDGRLDLDAPVTRYLPWFAVRSPHAPATAGRRGTSIAIRHLLTHTAGLVNLLELGPHALADVWALRETEVGFAPGEHFHYSNAGFKVLHLVLERALGRRYGEALRDEVLAPLGMAATTAGVSEADRSRMVTAPWLPYRWADGGLVTTPRDLTAFVRMLLAGGAPLLAPAAFARLREPVGERRPGVRYGMGLTIMALDGRAVVGHTGTMPGVAAILLADLDAGVGVAAYATAIADLHPFALDVLRTYAAAVAGRPLPEMPPLGVYAPPAPAKPPVDWDPDAPTALAPLCGRYGAYSPWLGHFEIGVRDGSLQLVYAWGQAVALTPLADGAWRVGDPPWSPERLRFGAEVEGRPLVATFSGVPYYRELAG